MAFSYMPAKFFIAYTDTGELCVSDKAVELVHGKHCFVFSVHKNEVFLSDRDFRNFLNLFFLSLKYFTFLK